MTPRDLLLWGGTGQARVIEELVGNAFRIVAVVDRALSCSPFGSAELLRNEADVDRWLAHRAAEGPLYAAVAIGGEHGAERRRLASFLRNRRITLPTLVHDTAWVASNGQIGDGSQILTRAVIGARSKIGASVIVNTGAQIDHDCVVADGVHLGPGVVTAGEVVIGQDAFIGTGAVILPRVKIGECAIVGAGAVVTRDVAAGSTVAGVPARGLQRSRNQAGA